MCATSPTTLSTSKEERRRENQERTGFAAVAGRVHGQDVDEAALLRLEALDLGAQADVVVLEVVRLAHQHHGALLLAVPALGGRHFVALAPPPATLLVLHRQVRRLSPAKQPTSPS